MTIEKAIPLRHPRLWQVIAGCMLVSTVWATLAPNPPRVQVAVLAWDKAQHAITYALLMWWCAQAFQKCRPLHWAILLLLMGFVLELLQHLSGARHMEIGDMVANGIGILVGFIAWLTPLGRTLSVVELCLGQGRMTALDPDSQRPKG